jgi:hypothetical protein
MLVVSRPIPLSEKVLVLAKKARSLLMKMLGKVNP